MKIKVRTKGNQIIVKVKISSELLINTNQSDLLSRKCNDGFLILNSVRKNKLEFTGAKGISLYDRLKSPISEYDFFFVIEQIVDITQKIEKIGLSRNNLVLDLKYIFLNETTKELSFIYLPIATPHSSIGILTFIEDIIHSAKPSQVDSKYLSDFCFFIKKLDVFDAAKVESYICRINSTIVSIIKNVEFVETGSSKTPNSKASEIHIVPYIEAATNHTACEEKTNLADEDMEKTDLFAEEESTVLFTEDDGKTELSVDLSPVSFKYPRLIRNINNEVIRIDKPAFRIGKDESSVDYIIHDNDAISRSHADIITKRGKYFVFDLRSKNKSYINNRVLPAEQEVEISNGDILKLANETFVFQV